MRHLVSLVAALALTASPTLAQEFSTTLVADFTGEGLNDRAELIAMQRGDDATLKIWNNGNFVLEVPGIAWVGGIGQEPELAVTPHGSLQVISMNEAIGRNRWHETLTIAYRRGVFVVAGYTYDWYDTLNLNDQGTCDMNFLSGKTFVDIGPDRTRIIRPTEMTVLPLALWPGDIPKVCADYLN
ncbi:hypothetical protein [Aliiroseovarius sp.]|uniref:hypothetical protein n=1 Tax=Aliiroseovarius sp. TaxID=1872442 RepID=UPI003BAB1275